jgi:hypothetical protein
MVSGKVKMMVKLECFSDLMDLDLLRKPFRKSKEYGKVGLFFISYDLDDSSGMVSGKDLFLSYSGWTFPW